jgi:hypothetical protein
MEKENEEKICHRRFIYDRIERSPGSLPGRQPRHGSG